MNFRPGQPIHFLQGPLQGAIHCRDVLGSRSTIIGGKQPSNRLSADEDGFFVYYGLQLAIPPEEVQDVVSLLTHTTIQGASGEGQVGI
jgi:hypothetical protein